MEKNNGFTLMESLVGVAICGVIAVMAIPAYMNYQAKVQVAEAVELLNSQRVEASSSITKRSCPTNTLKGRFGTITNTGTFTARQGNSCSTGCEFSYKFNSAGVHSNLQNKVLAVTLLNNGKLSNNMSKTTLADKYKGGAFEDKSNIIGDNCTALTATVPKPTQGSVLTGMETGSAAPVPSAPPSPPAGGGTDETSGGSSGSTEPYDYNQDYATSKLYCYSQSNPMNSSIYCLLVSNDGKKRLAVLDVIRAQQGISAAYNVAAPNIARLRNKQNCINTTRCKIGIEDVPSTWDLKNNRYVSGKTVRNLFNSINGIK